MLGKIKQYICKPKQKRKNDTGQVIEKGKN
jgi:hypothetical protein